MRGRLLNKNELAWWYYDFLMKDFPANEIKPLDNIEKLYDEKRYEIHIYQNRSEQYVGYATLWTKPGSHTYLFDYLGVCKALRGQSIGQQILEDIGGNILAVDGDACLICEAEAPVLGDDEAENILRQRRINFYCRNGYIKMYEMATCGMRFEALAYKRLPKCLNRVMIEHKEIYGEDRADVIIPLPAGQIPPKPYWM